MIVASALLFTVSVFAQQKDVDPQEKAKKMTDKMKTELNLTDEQYKAVMLINEGFATEMAAHKEVIEETKKSHHNELSAILTPEQMQKAEQMRKNGKGKQHRKGKPID